MVYELAEGGASTLETINGEWIMKGCSSTAPDCLHSLNGCLETIEMANFTGRNGTCRIKSTYGNPGRRNKMISRTKKSVDTAFSGWDLVLMNQTNNISLKKLGFSRY